MQQGLPCYPGDPDDDGVSQWRPPLALAAFGGISAAAVAGTWHALQMGPHWLSHSRYLHALAFFLVALIVPPVALEVASMIHSPTARHLELRKYRAPDHWHRSMPRRTERSLLWRVAPIYIIGFAISLLVFLALSLHSR